MFRSAMIMIRAATPAALGAYEDGIQTLVTLFPNSWGVIQLADETIQREQWDIKAEERMRVGAAPEPKAPWDSIVRESAYGVWAPTQHWWKLHVEAPLAQRAASSGPV